MSATSTDVLLACAKRIAAAPRGGRELDAAFMAALGCETVTLPEPPARHSWKYRGNPLGFGYDAGRLWSALPHPTTDLRSIAGLLPSHAGWLVGHGRTRPDEPLGGARITSLNGEFLFAEAEAAHPALALAAAFLRAVAGGLRP